MSEYVLIIISVFLVGAAYPIDRHTWNYFETVNCLKTVVISQPNEEHLHHIFQLYMPCKLLGRDGRTMSILCDDSFDKLNIPDEYNTAHHPFIDESSCGDDFYKMINPRKINEILFDNDY